MTSSQVHALCRTCNSNWVVVHQVTCDQCNRKALMTSILGSIAERLWAATQSLPSGPPFNAYVEQLRGLSRELRTYVNHIESRLAQDARKSLLDSPFEVTTGRPGLIRCRGCHSGWSAPNQSFCSKCQESASRPKDGYQCTACGKPSSMDLCPLTSDGYHRPFGPMSLTDAADIAENKTTQEAWQSFMQQPKPGAAKDPIWIADPNDWRLKAPPRGDGAIANGGWRCAGAMGQTTSRGDHLISSPFYVIDPSSDTRHCCYCEACALELCGVKCPRYVQCISCGQEAQQGLTSQAKPCWLGPSHIWEPVSQRERILEPKKMREHILLTAPGEQVPVARLTPDQARALGYRLLTLAVGSK